MKKVIKITAITISIIFALLFILFFSTEWLFPEWNGSYDLGNGLYMMDWERGNRIIVHCSYKSGRTCYGGSYVIPHNYPREVYVKDAKANQEWIIVKAVMTENNQPCYYLIDKSFNIEGLNWGIDNCDSIIQSHIISTIDSLDFEKKLRQRKIIDLTFSE